MFISCKYTVIEKKEIMICYYRSSPTEEEYLKRMHQVWKEQVPESEITEQRPADQCRFIIGNTVFTKTELGELQRFTQGKGIKALPEVTQNGEAKQGERAVEESSRDRQLLSLGNQAPLPQEEQSPRTKEIKESKQRITEHLEQHKDNRIRLPELKLF